MRLGNATRTQLLAVVVGLSPSLVGIAASSAATIHACAKRLLPDMRKCAILDRRRSITKSAWGGRLPGELGGAPAVALPFDRDDLGVVDEAVDEGDRAAGVGEDGRPVGEGQIGREHETLSFVPAADDLEEQVGGAGVVGEVARARRGPGGRGGRSS